MVFVLYIMWNLAPIKYKGYDKNNNNNNNINKINQITPTYPC